MGSNRLLHPLFVYVAAFAVDLFVFRVAHEKIISAVVGTISGFFFVTVYAVDYVD